MAYKEEKKQHDHLLKLLKKHFSEDEVEEAMREFEDNEDDSDELMDMDQEIHEEDDEELPEDELMEDEGEEEEEEEEEELELPKDKRKGLAVVIIQKRMSKPKKDMY